MSLEYKMIKCISLLLIGTLFTFTVNARIHIKELGFSKIGENQGLLSIMYKGEITDEPELSVRDSIVQIEIPSAVVWPKIEKKITLGKDKFDTTLIAYQFDKGLARVRVLLPFLASKNNHKISFKVKKNRIDLYFPTVKASRKSVASYDESYLNHLLSDKKTIVNKGNVKKAISNDLTNFLNTKETIKKIDKVKTSQSSIKKKERWGSGFSIGNFVGKVIGFFAVIILFFYALVIMVKKGVFKKSKLGFLNNTQAVKVLSTTYIAPKRSVITIQAHDQVFLIGNSERGMHFLSEINNVTGMMKNSEKELSGSNFDTNMTSAEKQNIPQTIKEDITVSQNTTNPLTSFLNSGNKEKNRLSDKIKSKVKSLKSLQ